MRNKIHPEYSEKKIVCACGQESTVGTTYSKTKELHVNVCSACHPFFNTDKNKRVDERGRAEKFKRKFNL